MKSAAPRKPQRSACSNCTHVSRDGEALFCWARPPRAFLFDDGQLRSAYPPVKAEWRCGEWKKAMTNARR